MHHNKTLVALQQ